MAVSLHNIQYPAQWRVTLRQSETERARILSFGPFGWGLGLDERSGRPVALERVQSVAQAPTDRNHITNGDSERAGAALGR